MGLTPRSKATNRGMYYLVNAFAVKEQSYNKFESKSQRLIIYRAAVRVVICFRHLIPSLFIARPGLLL
jgi:hypothetical protein